MLQWIYKIKIRFSVVKSIRNTWKLKPTQEAIHLSLLTSKSHVYTYTDNFLNPLSNYVYMILCLFYSFILRSLQRKLRN